MSHCPWGPAWVADEGGMAWCPEGRGGGSGRRHAPLLGFVGFGGSGGNSGAEPWEKGGVKCSGEVLMLKSPRWVEACGGFVCVLVGA